MRDLPPLVLTPLPSRWTMGYLLLIHTLAAGAVAALEWTPALRGSLLLLVLASLLREWRREVGRVGKGVVRSAEWDAAGQWTLTLEGIGRLKGQLGGSSLIHPRLVILDFHTGGWRGFPLVLPPDSLEPELLRRLRMRLRVTGSPPPAGPSGSPSPTRSPDSPEPGRTPAT